MPNYLLIGLDHIHDKKDSSVTTYSNSYSVYNISLLVYVMDMDNLLWARQDNEKLVIDIVVPIIILTNLDIAI
jgi:hypothetical protein